MAGVRPHGLFAGQAGPGEPLESAGRGAQRTAAERGKFSLRRRGGRAISPALSERTSVLRRSDRFAPRYSVGQAGGRAEFFQVVLRTEQREPGDCRRFPSRESPRTGGKIFWAAKARRGCAEDQGAYAAGYVRAPCGDSG